MNRILKGALALGSVLLLTACTAEGSELTEAQVRDRVAKYNNNAVHEKYESATVVETAVVRVTGTEEQNTSETNTVTDFSVLTSEQVDQMIASGNSVDPRTGLQLNLVWKANGSTGIWLHGEASTTGTTEGSSGSASIVIDYYINDEGLPTKVESTMEMSSVMNTMDTEIAFEMYTYSLMEYTYNLKKAN